MTCRFRWPVAPVALAAAALAGAPAPADEPEIRIYETATVLARPLARATGSVSVLERDEIDALGVSSVADLIRFVPGVDISPTGPRSGFATAQIRGGEPNFTLVMIDGVPLNDITDQVGGAVDLNGLSVADVERIEVVRGPLSSFYGSTGLAGAINIITRRGSGSAGVTFGVAAGDDAVLQGRVALGSGSAERDYSVSAWSENEEHRIADDRFEQWGFQGNARVPAGSGELRLTGRVAFRNTEDYPEASGGPRLGTGATRDSSHDEASLGVEWRFGPEWRQKLYATAYRHELDRESPAIPPGPSGFVPATVEETTFTSWRVGWAMPGIEAGRIQLGFGAEVDFENGKSDAEIALPPPFDDGSFTIDRYIGGAFVELLAEHGPFLFELGARADLPEGFDPELSPRAGIRFQLPNRTTRLHVSLGRAFKLPSFFALSNPIVGNPDLDPEIVVGADVGVDHAFRAAGIDVSLGLFYNRFEDLVDFDFGTLMNVNESIESRGVEAAVTWKPLDALDLRANATHQNLDREDSSEPVRQRPEWYGGLRVTWRIAEPARLEFDGQWVSERDDEQIPTGPGTVAGYQVYGTAFSYAFARQWELRARLDNLVDRDYETFIGFPGAGRSFLVGLRRTR